MCLINDENLKPIPRRGIGRPIAQFPGVVHTAVRGRINLDDIQGTRPARRQIPAGITSPARGCGRSLGTVQAARQNPGAGRLAAAPRPRKQVSMVDPPVRQSRLQRLSYVFLTDYVLESVGTVAAIQGSHHVSTLPEPRWQKFLSSAQLFRPNQTQRQTRPSDAGQKLQVWRSSLAPAGLVAPFSEPAIVFLGYAV